MQTAQHIGYWMNGQVHQTKIQQRKCKIKTLTTTTIYCTRVSTVKVEREKQDKIYYLDYEALFKLTVICEFLPIL